MQIKVKIFFWTVIHFSFNVQSEIQILKYIYFLWLAVAVAHMSSHIYQEGSPIEKRLKSDKIPILGGMVIYHLCFYTLMYVWLKCTTF